MKTKPGSGPFDGTSNPALVKELRSHGLTCHVLTKTTFSDLNLWQAKDSLIVLNFIEPKDNEGHFVIFLGLTKTRIHFADPLSGKKSSLARQEFARRWWNERKTLKHWAVVVTQV